MKIRIHPHACERMSERGATRSEVLTTIQEGERFRAKRGRIGFRRNFPFGRTWRGRKYAVKQVSVIAVFENSVWVVFTVLTRYY